VESRAAWSGVLGEPRWAAAGEPRARAAARSTWTPLGRLLDDRYLDARRPGETGGHGQRLNGPFGRCRWSAESLMLDLPRSRGAAQPRSRRPFAMAALVPALKPVAGRRQRRSRPVVSSACNPATGENRLTQARLPV
jgi:hypothetical protein